MPKSYTEKERAQIKKALIQAALDSMLQKGITKTTVDELIAKVRIPKGTFYLFYPSKEMLLYDAFMEMEENVHAEIGAKLQQIQDDFSVESLTKVLSDFFQLTYSMGLLPLMINGELEVLMRKLPDEIVMQHIAQDDDFLVIFCQLFPAIEKESLKTYSAAFRALFFTAAYKREIGVEYDNALNLLIKGMVMQMWEAAK